MQWGYRDEVVRLGGEGARRCEACQGQQLFSFVLRYRVSHVGEAPLCWVSRRAYLSVCEACGGASAADPKAVMAGRNDPIPWTSRYGMAVGVAAMALVGLIVRLFIGWAALPNH
jgi:hypothetical protein